MHKRGKFIVLEGGEGSGKSSCLAYLRKELTGRGVIFSREPGGTSVGEQIRRILMSAKMAPLTEIFLFCASRAQHVAERILPALRWGRHVICDRFTGSTVAYQIYGRRRLSLLRVLYQLDRFATGGIKPDLVIYLDVKPRAGLRRKGKGGGLSTRFDRETLAFHQCVWRGFLDQCQQNPNWIRVDTTEISKKKVQARVWQIVSKALGIKE